MILFLVLSVADAASAERAVEAQRKTVGAELRQRIADLVKQDALKFPADPTSADRPAPPDLEAGTAEESTPTEVLELAPFKVTEKREVVLPPAPKLTLENFFYGDGMIARKGRVSLSAGPERLGLAALKVTIKF